MSELPALKKRLRSVRSTGEMASAMKTVATVKFSKLSRTCSQYKDYAAQCAALYDLLSDSVFQREEKPSAYSNAVVLISSNRGFCGSFNGELFRFFRSAETEGLFQGELPNLYFSLGAKAKQYFKARHIDAEELPLSDFPSFSEAQALSDRLLPLYLDHTVSTIYLVYQQYINVMVQKPTAYHLLPASKPAEQKTDADLLFLPDRAAFSSQVSSEIMTSRIYDILLQVSTGAQAATLVSMRSACDNAEKTAAQLELTINRMRQAEVTSSVIELTSGAAFNGG